MVRPATGGALNDIPRLICVLGREPCRRDHPATAYLSPDKWRENAKVDLWAFRRSRFRAVARHQPAGNRALQQQPIRGRLLALEVTWADNAATFRVAKAALGQVTVSMEATGMSLLWPLVTGLWKLIPTSVCPEATRRRPGWIRKYQDVELRALIRIQTPIQRYEDAAVVVPGTQSTQRLPFVAPLQS